jgi:hypothetical protein
MKPDHDKTCRCDACAEYWAGQKTQKKSPTEAAKAFHSTMEEFEPNIFKNRDPRQDGKMKQVEPDRERYDPKSRYYDAGGLEVLEIIRAKLTPEQYQGFCLGNAIKYTCRANHKGDYVRDLEKAEFYAREAR